MITTIRCGTLLDGTQAEPLRDASIIIENGLITDVNRSGYIPRESEVIDATHLVVMPGMIDCHVHLRSVSDKTIGERLSQPYTLGIAQAIVNARVMVEGGFTSVRDGGGLPLGVKLAIEQHLFPGPRLKIAITGLSQTGGASDRLMPSGVNLRADGPEHPRAVVDGVDAMRTTTRELIRAGADQIKIFASGGVNSPNDEPTSTAYTPEEIAAVVYEARAAGKRVMAHAQAKQGILNAVNAGVDTVEHGYYLDEEVAARMKERGTFLVPTLLAPLWSQRREQARPGSVPPYAVRKAANVIDASRRSFRLAVELGVPIAMGTDIGVVPHDAGAEELSLMVENGMTPLQAIASVTSEAARCCGFEGLGLIAQGMRADLIGVDGEPHVDVAILQDRSRIVLVLKDGQRLKDTLA